MVSKKWNICWGSITQSVCIWKFMYCTPSTEYLAEPLSYDSNVEVCH